MTLQGFKKNLPTSFGSVPVIVAICLAALVNFQVPQAICIQEQLLQQRSDEAKHLCSTYKIKQL